MVLRRVDAPQEVGEHVGCCGTSVFSQAASTRRPSHPSTCLAARPRA